MFVLNVIGPISHFLLLASSFSYLSHLFLSLSSTLLNVLLLFVIVPLLLLDDLLAFLQLKDPCPNLFQKEH